MRELCVHEGDEPAARAGGPRPVPPAAAPQRSRTGSQDGGGGARVSIPALIADKTQASEFFWSVELLPGTTPLLQSLLDESLQHLALAPRRPAFASVTWHVDHLVVDEGEGEDGVVRHPALELCARLQDALGIPALMHLAAGRMGRGHVLGVLAACLEAGVTNVLALRGDYLVDASADFPHASDLVQFIRKHYGAQFNIGVAGYPLGHPETESREANFAHLKEKVCAGADFILTQMVSSAEEFHLFREECDNLGIRIPIIPGIFLIQSYKTFEKLTRICNITVSDEIFNFLKDLQNENKEREYGEHLFKKLVGDLMEFQKCPGTHIFSMNRVAAATKVLDEVMFSHD